MYVNHNNDNVYFGTGFITISFLKYRTTNKGDIVSIPHEYRIFWEQDITMRQLALCIKTAKEFFNIAGVGPQRVKLKWGHELDLSAYKCVDENGRMTGSLDADMIADDPKIVSDDYYSLVMTKTPLSGEDGEFVGASWDRILIIHMDYSHKLNNRIFKLSRVGIIFHELGHRFGLIPEERTEEVKILVDSESKHCADKTCVMYPVVNKEVDSYEEEPFCSICLRDMHDYVKSNLVP